MIHPSTIEEIKNRINIVDVVGDFVRLKRSGSSFKALSPFTTEKTPSFYVVPSKGIFKDFSSGKGGDAITFVMEMDGLSYVEALKYLATKYGIEIQEEEQTDEAMEVQNERESLHIVLNYANEYFQRVLHDGGQSAGLAYFKERGFSEDTIKKFELGYSKEIWDGLLNDAIQKGYQKELLEEAGLIVTKEDRSYDRFRGRIMFPIHNISGKPVAFGGRKLTGNDEQPKYINSPETKLYDKSRVLYGMFQAKSDIRKEDNCILVEGYTDVMALHQSGMANVVSSSGTALTEDQVKLIRRHTENVTVLFDGDSAGIKASLRGIDLLLEEGLNVKAVALPEGEDPDSYSRYLGALGFRNFVAEKSQDIIRFKTNVLLRETSDDPVKKADVIKDIVSSIARISDPIKRTVYIKDCSDLMGISESVLVAEQNKILIRKRKGQKGDPIPNPMVPDMEQEALIDELDIAKIIEFQEKESVRILLNYGKSKILGREKKDQYLINYFLNESKEIQFTNKTYRKIIELFEEKWRKGEIVDGKHLLYHPDEEVRKTVVNLMADKYEVSENWEGKYQIDVPRETNFLKDVIYTNVLRLKFRFVQQMIKEENEKLKGTRSSEKESELLEEINDLKKVEVEIAKILGNVLVG